MRKPWLLASLGLLAFSSLVWFAGPLLSVGGAAPLATPQARILLAAAFVIQYLLQKWWSARRARLDNERVVSVLAPAGRSAAGSSEAALLEERFASALQTLRTTRFGPPGGFWSSLSWKFGRQYLYQLPWYMIIGAPGAGKTTALLNSGLSFPLADTLGRGSVRGVGGTRNCDWWFTDRAVLIDTAGRYTTHESDRVADRQAWQAFLGLLRQSRPRQPLNGALVAVSISDLLGFGPQQLAEHADTLRARIDELQTALGMRIPVYLLVTKCDLMAGFVDWFFELERRDRDQVWGVTFEGAASDAGEAPGQFAAAFDRLADRLGQGVVARLLTERDGQRRGRILALPRQFRGLRDPLDELVRRVFGPRAKALSGPATCLRGVYFTSGTQEGTPIDRMLAALGREIGLQGQIVAPSQNSGRSFFLARVMNEVVFAEAELAGRSLSGRRWRRGAIMAAMAAVQSAAVVLAASWANGYSRTSDSLARAQQRAALLRPVVQAMPAAASPDPRALLPALDAVRAFAAERADASRSSDVLLLGLARRPQRKLAAAASQAYERLLLGPLLAGIRADIDDQLRSGADINLQYEALKAYAMLNDPAHFDAAALDSFVLFDWDTRSDPPLAAAERAALAEHLGALLQAGAVGAGSASDAALVDSVRSRLNGQPALQRIATRLRAQLGALPVADFTIAAGGAAAADLFVGADGRSAPRVVPGRYTLEVYRNSSVDAVPAISSQLAAEAPWVLGAPLRPGPPGPQAADQTTAQVFAIYDADYARAWVDFIDDLRLKRAARNDDAVHQAQILAARDGPLATLLRKVVEQSAPVARASPAQPDPAVTPRPAGGSSRQARQPPAPPAPGPDDRLAQLRQFVLPAADGRSGLDLALATFNEIRVLRSLTGAAGASAPAPSDIATASANRLEQLRADARRDPEPVRSMLLALAVMPLPASDGPPPLGTDAPPAGGRKLSALQRQVLAKVGAPCVQSVPGRFPFDRGAAREIPLDEFARLFASGGTFSEAFDRLLASRVDVTGEPWVMRDRGAELGPEDLERFRSAARIRGVFFARGAAQPSLKLIFRPVDLDESIDRVQIQIDGQAVRYAHGPQTPTSITWPGPQAQGDARLDLTPPVEGAAPLAFSGRWALFRLMDRAAIQPGGTGGNFRVVFNVGGRRATFDVESDSGVDPFRLPELERFDCPGEG